MISFNEILRHESLEPSHMKLIRHQDSRYPKGPTPYQLWRAADGRFERYQCIQRTRKVFEGAKVIASFVGTPFNETLFVGLYAVKRLEKASSGTLDPVSGEDVGGMNLYTLDPMPELTDYSGRMVVDWGKGYRSWFQWAGKNPKPVVEIRRTISDPPFPGFLNFCASFSHFPAIPVAWRVALASVGGIYLLSSPKHKKHYVGLAAGSGGFWSRWEDYLASGHGGNQRMQEVPADDYQVTILEVAASSANGEELASMESKWKRKLMSREFGLNAN